MNKFDAFRKLLTFVNDSYKVVDAYMCNYAGDIEIHGEDKTGATITVRVTMKEGENGEDAT